VTNDSSGCEIRPRHLHWEVSGAVAKLTLTRPGRKNALTFQSYRELVDIFRTLCRRNDVKVVILTGSGSDFCSGGDVHEIIGPLVEMQRRRSAEELLKFTRLTGEVVRAMRACQQVIIAAIDGICAGAGAILAMASDMRIGTPRSRVAFLFVRVGLSGADMGACALLPRIIGQGRASDLLYTGRFMNADEAERCGFYNRVVPPEMLLSEAGELARSLAAGPTVAHAATKRCLDAEWNMGLEQAIETEAQAQALCMATEDFARAYRAFIAKQEPVFKGD
jgi:enoyl-CoA hydratase/carnithine racemase